MREPATSQIIAGKYRLESLIGHGGMGSVWRAQHVTLGMPVAIKFMGEHAISDPESRKRFDREARALATLRTPHIVQVLDHGVDDDTPYIVMELLEGEDLSTRLLRDRRLPLDEISRILAQVARALRRAHDAGVTHRDLKPSNIFLARIDDDTIVKVLDFGVAKLAAPGLLEQGQLTQTGTLLGSPGYMSPEQARGKDVDFRSDLWALAVILFRAVTGVKPFAGDSIAELVIKLCIDPRPVASRLAPDVPPSIDRFFERAFAATPEDRFPSAMEMATAFAQIAGHPGPELSRTGPSPVAGLSAALLDAAPRPVPSAPASWPQTTPGALAIPPAPTSPSARAPAPSFAAIVPPPPRTTSSATPTPGSSPLPVFGELPPARMPALSSAAHREPTPTPASFAGFAPSGADTASAPPSADPAAALLLSSDGLRPPPMGALAETAARPGDPPTPTGARTAPDSAPGAARPLTAPAIPSPRASAPARPAPPVDLKVLAFAALGVTVLAVFFTLAISGLRRRHAVVTVPDDDHPGASPLDPADPSDPGPPTSTATADPSVTASPTATADPSATASATATADPSATAVPSSTATVDPSATATAEPYSGPTVVEAPIDPAPATSATATGARPPGTKPAISPTGSGKKKGPRPNFGY